jgi:ectoine hydroxylase-related dioxygenase (phytanoyl-CoA dioxygenase family)
MPKRLTQAQIERFRAEGYLSGLPAMSAVEAAAVRARIERFEAARPADVSWAFDIKANLLFDWLYEISADARALDLVEDLIGPNILVTNTVFRIKEPGSRTHYGWHQDSARIRVEPAFVILYLAITESTAENGGLRVIPGSHDRVRPFDIVVNTDGQARRCVPRTRDVDAAKAVDLVLAPGEAAIFSGDLIHGSASNQSAARRIAILTDYTTAHACQSTGQGSGQLVRGEDRWHHFAPEPVPVGDCTRDNVLMRRRTLQTYPENPLMGPLAPGEAIDFPDAPN